MKQSLLERAHQQAQEAANVFQLPLKDKLWQARNGHQMGRGSGSSVDFLDHRLYVPGDDPRHINWQAYARTGQVIMKTYQEEVSLHMDIVLDLSQSMALDEQKQLGSLALSYFVLEQAWQHNISVNFFTATPLTVDLVNPALLQSHQWLAEWSPLFGQPKMELVPWRKNSVRVVVSDVLFPGTDDFFMPFANNDGLSLVVAPYSEQESNPNWRGSMTFIDCETDEKHKQRMTSKRYQRYLTNYQTHFAWWQEKSLYYQVGLVRIPTSKSLADALQAHALPQGLVEWAPSL